jgi:hypothetical protein
MNTHSKMVKYGFATAFLALAALAASPLAVAQAGLDAAGTLNGAAKIDGAANAQGTLDTLNGAVAHAKGVVDSAAAIETPVKLDTAIAASAQLPDVKGQVDSGSHIFADLGAKIKGYFDGLVSMFYHQASETNAEVNTKISSSYAQVDAAKGAAQAHAEWGVYAGADGAGQVVGKAQGAADGTYATATGAVGDAKGQLDGTLATVQSTKIDATLRAHLEGAALPKAELPSPPPLPAVDTHMGFFAEMAAALSGIFHLG